MLTVLAKGGDGRSAVARTDGGAVVVQLDDDHPGVADPEYRARRDAIAKLSLDWSPTQPVPDPGYTEREHETWRTVSSELHRLWQTCAASAFADAATALALPTDHIPQLGEVSARLRPISGFTYLPVAGLAPLRTFYEAFGDGVFWSTQYLRHHSRPLYTPEPDLCHEVLGHANQLADPRFADLYRRVAAATARVESGEALSFLSKVFWFTIEFGVVAEPDGLRAYGAGLLSSFGELQAFRDADVRPVDWAAMGTQTYDITRYQTVLYEVPSLSWLVDEFSAFLDRYDDDVFAELTGARR